MLVVVVEVVVMVTKVEFDVQVKVAVEVEAKVKVGANVLTGVFEPVTGAVATVMKVVSAAPAPAEPMSVAQCSVCVLTEL